SVFFHGSGGPGGRPLTISCDALLPPVGGKRITSNFSRRFGVRDASWVEMYVYGTFIDSSASRHQPSSCVRSHVCMIAIRGRGASFQCCAKYPGSALFDWTGRIACPPLHACIGTFSTSVF